MVVKWSKNALLTHFLYFHRDGDYLVRDRVVIVFYMVPIRKLSMLNKMHIRERHTISKPESISTTSKDRSAIGDFNTNVYSFIEQNIKSLELISSAEIIVWICFFYQSPYIDKKLRINTSVFLY